MKTKHLILFSLVSILIVWITWDLLKPIQRDIRDFDPKQRAINEAAMWRSYYEKKPIKLFWQLTSSLRYQYNFPFWRSVRVAYKASKAAFVFKNGKNREEYAKALPLLRQFFTEIQTASQACFDVNQIAEWELEWWIIRREPHRFSPKDWKNILRNQAGALYQMAPERTSIYAARRTQAMVIRDSLGQNITEADWKHLEKLLLESWTSLQDSLIFLE